MAEKAEANTYGLPRGEPIRRALVRHFRAQRKWALSQIASWTSQKDLQDDIPAAFPPFPQTLGALELADQMTPLVSVYWDQSGQQLNSRLGIDPDAWRVTNPHTESMIRRASFDFSASTNATTAQSLDKALDKLREELIAGVVKSGESVEALTDRVNSIFTKAEEWRARRIAQTEASRAVHAAQDEAGRQSGVVAGWEWLLSGDACPMCQTVARRARSVRLGQPFAEIGDNPTYRHVRHPPLHPHCNCTMLEVLTTEAGDTDWAQTLVDPKPEEQDKPDYEPEPGKEPPVPKPSIPFLEKPPVVAKPAPTPKPAPVPQQALPEPEPQPTVESRLEEAARYAAEFKVSALTDGNDIITKLMGQNEAKTIPAAFVHSKAASFIALNQNHPYWADPKSWMAKQRAIGQFSTDAENHPILHEVGHAMHLRNVGREQYRKLDAIIFTADEKSAIAKEVSRYAATNARELVAEVYAGHVTGKTYSPQLTSLYKAMGGPEVAAPKKPKPKPAHTPKPKKPKPAPTPRPEPPIAAVPPRPSDFRPAAGEHYKPFANDDAASAWGERYRETILAWTDQERQAVASYANNAFTLMNAMERGDVDAVPKKVRKQVAKLNAEAKTALVQGKTDRPVVAYRGVANIYKMGFKSVEDFQEGVVITEKGFGSMSLSQKTGIGFATNDDKAYAPVVFEIRMPTGSTGVFLNAGDLAVHHTELEFLAPPDTEYRVVGRGKKVTNHWGKEADVVILERVR